MSVPLRISLLLVFVGITLSVWHVGWGFDPRSGAHWQWVYGWAERGLVPPGLGIAFVVALGLVVSIAGGFIMFSQRIRSRTVEGGFGDEELHGTARWAGEKDVKAAGLKGTTGVVVGGRHRFGRTRALRHNGPEHVLAFAPTRSGKGVGLVLPTLLSWEHSVLVLDIKGENHALTAGWRASKGQRIFKFNPAEDDPAGCRFNPLAEVRVETDYEVRDVQNIAAMIIDPEGKGLRDFWMKSGFAWLAASILHVLYKVRRAENGRCASLYDLSEFMSSSEDLKVLLQDMIAYEHGRDAANEFVRSSASEMLARKISAPQEFSGVHSSAITELALYRDPIVARNTSASDWCIADLMNGDAPASLYLVVPPSDLDRLRPLMRVVFNVILRRLTQEMAFAEGKSVAGYKHRLLLMLDEFTSVGKLEIFERALAFMAGYGLKCFLIVQDLTQLQQAYGREESIMSNCHIRIAYAPNKIETAKVLSEMSGKTTVIQKKRSRSINAFRMIGNVSESMQATARPLLTADECMQLPGMEKRPNGKVKRAGDMLVFPAGFSTIYGRQFLYFQDKELLRRAKMPPPGGSDGREQDTIPDCPDMDKNDGEETVGEAQESTPAEQDSDHAGMLASRIASAGGIADVR